ncbi:MAG: protease [Loktanella sp.]|nr:protease [Loktanella sp.]
MRLAVVLIFLVFGQMAMAQATPGCDVSQAAMVRETLDQAKSLTIKAAAAVGDTPEYARWFGSYSEHNAETVRANLKAIVTAFRSGAVVTQCDTARDDGCSSGEYAWVYPYEPYRIYLCPGFFNMIPLQALKPGTTASDNGTAVGTIVHEMSHFNTVARTADHCYTRQACAAMASIDPVRAIDNADSYQYFTEDVIYYASQPVAGKPAR